MAYKLLGQWLPQHKYRQKAPYPMKPKGIIVHNTAGSASAIDERNTMVNANNTISYHVVIDEANIVEIIPFNRNAWHAGDGEYGFANRNLIGIEIARSTSDKALYLKAEDNAATYIANALKDYGWGVDKLYKHKQFSATACPHRTEELGWKRFIDKVQKELEALKNPKPQVQSKPKEDGKPSKWAEAIWKKGAEIGLVDGTNPKAPATREEVVAIVIKSQKLQ